MSQGYKDVLIRAQLEEKWSTIIGEKLAKTCIIEDYEGGNLIISTTSSPLRNELQFLAKDIMENIKKQGKFSAVKRIIFR